jgi:hypothetical protein
LFFLPFSRSSNKLKVGENALQMANYQTTVVLSNKTFFRFDNQQWVSNNGSFRETNIQGAFMIVSFSHPLGGMAYKMEDEKEIMRSVRKKSEIRLFADAVTVAKPKELYESQLRGRTNFNFSNFTSLANLLYIESVVGVKLITAEDVTQILNRLLSE